VRGVLPNARKIARVSDRRARPLGSDPRRAARIYPCRGSSGTTPAEPVGAGPFGASLRHAPTTRRSGSTKTLHVSGGPSAGSAPWPAGRSVPQGRGERWASLSGVQGGSWPTSATGSARQPSHGSQATFRLAHAVPWETAPAEQTTVCFGHVPAWGDAVRLGGERLQHRTGIEAICRAFSG